MAVKTIMLRKVMHYGAKKKNLMHTGYRNNICNREEMEKKHSTNED